MAGTTTRGAFPFPTGGDNWKQVRLAVAALADRVGVTSALYVEGLASARPTAAAGNAGTFYRATDTGIVSVSSGSAWSTVTPKTVRIPHTFTVGGEVLLPTATDYYLPPFPVPAPSGQTAALAGLRVRLNSGTSVTAELRKNGAAIGSSFTVSSSTWTSVARTTTFADLDDLALVVTAVSGTPRGLSVAALIDYGV